MTEITDAMVDRACVALWGPHGATDQSERDAMREALNAALDDPPVRHAHATRPDNVGRNWSGEGREDA
jgi:hypothetical protein